MELWRYYRILYRRKWLLLLGIVLCMGVAIALAITEPVKYTATARVMERSPSYAGGNVFPEGVYTPIDPSLRLSNLARIARSTEVYGRVAERLLRAGFVWEQGATIPDNVRAMQKSVSVMPERDTQLLLITVTHEQPDIALQAANMVIEEFDNFYREKIYGSSTQREYIEQQVALAKQDLDSAREALKQYKAENRLSSVEYETQVVLQKLGELEAQLRSAQVLSTEAQQRATRTEQELGQLPRTREEVRTTADNSIWITLTNELTKKENELASMLTYRGESHPEVQALQKSIDELKTKQAEETRQRLVQTTEGVNPVYTATLERYVQAKVDAVGTQAKTQALARVVPQVRAELANYPANERMVADLTTEVRAAESTYGILRQKLDEARVRENEPFATGTIEVVDRPFAPQPASNKRLKVLLAIPLSILLSAAVIFLLDYLDNSVRTPEQTEDLLGLPVAAMVPIGKGHSLIKGLPDYGLRESYQMLSASLWHNAVEESGRGPVLVASAEPDSGRTVTAGNLAAALAGDGARVILVDADMRQPAQHLVFGVDNSKGLSNVLAGTASFEDVALPTRVEGLLLIPSGPVPENPVRLLRSEGMEKFLEDAVAVADFVIFDSPAGSAFADATVLASYIRRVLMVQAAGRVPRGAEHEFKARLDQVGVDYIGAVLNKVRPDDSHGVYHVRTAYAGRPPSGGGPSGKVSPTTPAIPG